MDKRIIVGLIIIFLICIGVIACMLLNNNQIQKGDNNMLENINSEKVTDYSNMTRVKMTMNDEVVYARINDTVTGKAFLELLPYEVTVSRATDDLCGSVSEDLPTDSSEGRHEWKIGEIGWFGGWFTILVDHEENFSNMPGVMIIGNIEDEYINYVKNLKGNVNIKVDKAPEESEKNDSEDNEKLTLVIGDKKLRATLENNKSAQELKKILKDGAITINMSDYANMEKVGSLGFSVTRSDKQIDTDYGDIILYQGNSLVIYYDKNNWNFTKLGHIDNITQEELKQILGSEDVTVTLSLEK